MTRILSQFWMIAISLNLSLACALYHIKYKVIDLEHSHLALQKKYNILSESNHTLNAEYTFLSNPKRLATLAKKYLDKKYTNPVHLQHVSVVKLAHVLDLKSVSSNPIPRNQKVYSIRLASYQQPR